MWCVPPDECCAHLRVDACGLCDLEKSLLNASHPDYSLYTKVRHVLRQPLPTDDGTWINKKLFRSFL